MTCITNGAENAYPSEAPQFTPHFVTRRVH